MNHVTIIEEERGGEFVSHKKIKLIIEEMIFLFNLNIQKLYK
jgi:hypothetical protein